MVRGSQAANIFGPAFATSTLPPVQLRV